MPAIARVEAFAIRSDGRPARTGDAARLAAWSAADQERWAPAVKAAGITPG